MVSLETGGSVMISVVVEGMIVSVVLIVVSGLPVEEGDDDSEVFPQPCKVAKNTMEDKTNKFFLFML